MKLYVKDSDMPKSCIGCQFKYNATGGLICMITKSEILKIKYKEIHKDCPLIPLSSILEELKEARDSWQESYYRASQSHRELSEKWYEDINKFEKEKHKLVLDCTKFSKRNCELETQIQDREKVINEQSDEIEHWEKCFKLLEQDYILSEKQLKELQHHVAYSDKEIVKIHKQLEITHRALELACEFLQGAENALGEYRDLSSKDFLSLVQKQIDNLQILGEVVKDTQREVNND